MQILDYRLWLALLQLLTLADCKNAFSASGEVVTGDARSSQRADTAERAREVDNIFDVVFREMFRKYESGKRPPDAKYYISIETESEGFHDPSDVFLQRFRDVRPPVRAASALRDRHSGLVLPSGFSFSAGPIQWLDANTVMVHDRSREIYSKVSLEASFRLEKGPSGWVITQRTFRASP